MSYVYVITDDDIVENEVEFLTQTKHIKIGFTSNEISSRIGQLQTGNSRKLNLVYLYTFDSSESAKAIERICHQKLKDKRTIGEWFSYDGAAFHLFSTLKALCLHFESFTVPDEENFYLPSSLKLEVANG